MKTKIFLFALMNFFFLFSCSKKDEPKSPPNDELKPGPVGVTHFMTFTTEKKKGDTIFLRIEAAEKDVWIDLNDNGVKDEGEELVSSSRTEYVIQSQSFTVCGKVTAIYCDATGLTELNFSKNTALTKIFCRFNKLTELDLSKNQDLNLINCSGNKFTTLDLTYSENLEVFECSYNQLSSLKLDLSKNKFLSTLIINNNNINLTAMQQIIDNLTSCPVDKKGSFVVMCSTEYEDNNKIKVAQVKELRDKNWEVKKSNRLDYPGQ